MYIKPRIKAAYITSSNVRIIDQGDVVILFANTGSLKGMDAEWELLIGDLPYPMIAEDRMGYSFQNTAAQQMDRT